MAGATQEKRRETRHPYGEPITYMGRVHTPGSSPQELPFHGKIVDMSNGGMGIETKGHAFLETGSMVRTWIPMSNVPIKVPVLTRVQWVRDKLPAGSSQIVGLMFVL